jgi:ABC-type multidrug transport system fused ATPase/permease subunit
MLHLKNLFKYWSFFKDYIGRHLYLYIFANLVLSFVEIIGFSLFAPLVTQVFVTSETSDPISIYFEKTLNFLDLPNTLIVTIAFIIILMCLKALILYCCQFYGYILLGSFTSKLRKHIINLFSTMTYRYYCKQNTGDLTNTVIIETNRTINAFKKYIQYIAVLINLSAIIIATLFFSIKFTLMALGFGLLYLIITKWVIAKSKKYSIFTTEHNGNLQSLLIQTLQSYKYLKTTSRFTEIIKRTFTEIDLLVSLIVRGGGLSSFMKSFSEPFTVLVLMIFIYVQIEVLHQPFSEIIVIILLLFKLVKKITESLSMWQKFSAQTGGIDCVQDNLIVLSEQLEQFGQQCLKSTPSFELKNISFSYADTPVLNKINLSIQPNSMVALVGASGSGKTTIVDLLTGILRQDTGQILINGTELFDLDMNKYRHGIGLVPQDIVLFDDTIANNISLWQADINNPLEKEKVKKAAQKANCYDFISKTTNGFESLIGDRGLLLSGGQKQRLAIARELYKKPDILILDEATSALDSESEICIQKSIDALKGQLTVIIIAHRLSTIKNCDKIFVLEDGYILESGSFNELLSLPDSKFSKMCLMQKLF